MRGVPRKGEFSLHYLEDLSYQEIAAVCDGTIDAVRSRIYRARMHLRTALSTGVKVTI